MQHAVNGTTINVEFELNGEIHRSTLWTSSSVIVKGTERLIAKMLKDLHEAKNAEVFKICKVESVESCLM